MAEGSATKTSYQGSCQCKAVRFSMDYPSLSPPDSTPVTSCNCSMCARNGYLLVRVPKQDFHLEQGDDKMQNFRWASKKVEHKFCTVCGSSIMIDFCGMFGDVLGVNVSGPFPPSFHYFCLGTSVTYVI